MKNTKLHQAISILSEKEVARFQSFAASPYFNKREDIIKVVDLLQDPVYKDTISKEDAYKLIYGEKTYNDSTMRLLISDTYKLMDRFLAYEELKETEVIENIYALKAYRKKFLRKAFESKLSGVKKKMRSRQLRDSEFLWHDFLLESEYNLFLEESKVRKHEPNLQVAMNSLDNAYVAQKLKYMCLMLNYNNVASTPYIIELRDPVIELVEKLELYNIPAIGIYYWLYKAFNDFSDEKNFRLAFSQVRTNWDIFSRLEARQLYLFGVNYCIKKVIMGENSYEVMMLDMFKEMIEHDIILENGYMSPWLYKNVTSIGLRLGETNWTTDFLQKYKNHIDPHFKDNAYVYNLAKVHFHNRNFTKVIETLRSVEFSDLFYALDVRAMLLKTYFELKEFVVMNALATSFRQFVNRQTKLSSAHKQNYLNLISFTRKVAKAQYTNDDVIAKLMSQLQSKRDISDRKWLLRKLNEILYKDFKVA